MARELGYPLVLRLRQSATAGIPLVIPLWYLPSMAKTAISIDDNVLAVSKQCAADLGMSFSAWLTDAARVAARRQNAEAYGRWLAGQSEAERTESADLDRLDEAARAETLNGVQW